MASKNIISEKEFTAWGILDKTVFKLSRNVRRLTDQSENQP